MKTAILTLALIVATAPTHAESWTYRGTLADGGKPANGRYDLRLSLRDEAAAKSIATPITLYGVEVKNGSFEAEVDFGIDLSHAPILKLVTEVAQGGSSFMPIGEPTRFDAKAVLAGICWDTAGNAVSAGEFIGSTNNQPLELRASNQAIVRLTGGLSNGAANIVAGATNNSVNALRIAQTIAGGGNTASTCGLASNATCRNATNDDYATVSGGVGNNASALGATVAGGVSNTASQSRSFVGGGIKNTASGFDSAIAGGSENLANNSQTAVAGGSQNKATGSASSVGGGTSNTASGTNSRVGGGLMNLATNTQSTIAGGGHNQANGTNSVVGGGDGNLASVNFATIAGGEDNTVAAVAATVGGGSINTASGDSAVIAGGYANTASGQNSTVAGGYYNCAGALFSWAGGNKAKVRPGSLSGAVGSGCNSVPSAGFGAGDAGTFVWADSQLADFVSSGKDQFLVRANGGMGLNTSTLGNAVDLRLGELVIKNSTGDPNTDISLMNSTNRGYGLASIPGTGGNAGEFYVSEVDARTPSVGFFNRLRIDPNGITYVVNGTVGNISDARLKKNIALIDRPLDQLLSLQGHTFEYIDPKKAMNDPGVRMGFVAQEVQQTIPTWVKTGSDGYLSVVPAGFEALAVEAMRDLKAEKDVEIAMLREQNQKLLKRLEAIEARIAR